MRVVCPNDSGEDGGEFLRRCCFCGTEFGKRSFKHEGAKNTKDHEDDDEDGPQMNTNVAIEDFGFCSRAPGGQAYGMGVLACLDN